MTKRIDINAEMLMAYADGELPPLEAKRVERAVATDPALAQQVEAHHKLRSMLANGFAVVTDAPVPDRLAALLQPGPVVNLGAARLARDTRPVIGQRWGAGLAIAASLIIGLLIGQQLDRGPVVSSGGTLIASAGLARALDTQLAAASPAGASLRMLVTFRDRQGAICRSFSGDALSGIACRDGNRWQLRETRAGQQAGSSDYRQAGSANAALMADAQAMMAGDPLDAEAEAVAKAAGWR